ncbi:MAG: DUF169 domain-containing protein [Methanomicrobiaceae archaeon]|nr:DUF169 domain-containing protein [Methanomicrobiaceae archaeon]
MQDEMRKKLNYAEIAGIFTEYLGLDGSPVAIKLAKSREGIPDGISEIPESVRHCQMATIARKEGKIFYATSERHQCMGGGWALGLKTLSPSLQSGEFYYKLGKFESWAACMRTIGNIPHVHAPGSLDGTTWATVYAPLEKTPFDPHVVLVIAEPRAMLKLAQAILYKTGGRIHSSMSGIQSVCADTVALPYMTGAVNFSMGCDGSRKFSGIADNEMVMGIPGELLPEIAEAIKIVTGAPGSV